MNKKDQGRIARAKNEGRNAYLLGLPVSVNPYKVSAWGVGSSWNMGYSQAQNEHKRREWENLLSRMLLCQYGFDLATFRKVMGEAMLNHLYTLYSDNPQTLLDDFDFTVDAFKLYYTPDE